MLWRSLSIWLMAKTFAKRLLRSREMRESKWPRKRFLLLLSRNLNNHATVCRLLLTFSRTAITPMVLSLFRFNTQITPTPPLECLSTTGMEIITITIPITAWTLTSAARTRRCCPARPTCTSTPTATSFSTWIRCMPVRRVGSEGWSDVQSAIRRTERSAAATESAWWTPVSMLRAASAIPTTGERTARRTSASPWPRSSWSWISWRCSWSLWPCKGRHAGWCLVSTSDASCERFELTPRRTCRLIRSITSSDLLRTLCKEEFAHLYYFFVLLNVPPLLTFFTLFHDRREGNTSFWELCGTSTLLCR